MRISKHWIVRLHDDGFVFHLLCLSLSVLRPIAWINPMPYSMDIAQCELEYDSHRWCGPNFHRPPPPPLFTIRGELEGAKSVPRKIKYATSMNAWNTTKYTHIGLFSQLHIRIFPRSSEHASYKHARYKHAKIVTIHDSYSHRPKASTEHHGRIFM